MGLYGAPSISRNDVITQNLRIIQDKDLSHRYEENVYACKENVYAFGLHSHTSSGRTTLETASSHVKLEVDRCGK